MEGEKKVGRGRLIGRLRSRKLQGDSNATVEDIQLAKKQLRERKGFQVFDKLFPELAKVAGNFVPGAGLIGQLYSGISEKIISIKDEGELKAVETMFQEALDDEALLSYVLSNTNSARNREMFLSSVGVHDWMKHMLGISSVLSFYLLILSLIFVNLTFSETIKDLFFLLVGRLSGHVDAIFNYYFGSSLGSYIQASFNRLVPKKENEKTSTDE